jgi:hypothetical protein
MVKRASKQEDHKRVRAAAEKFLDLCAAGEQWANKELFERADGKVIATHVLAGDPNAPLQLLASELRGKKSALPLRDSDSDGDGTGD